MATPVSTINVVSQLGQEASPGAGGSAGKKLQSLNIEPGRELTVKEIASAGHRFLTGSAVDQQWTSFGVSADQMLYTEHLYCLENLFGTVSPTVLGVATQKRVYEGLLSGAITPKTWTHQWGDPADAASIRQYGYGLLTDYGEKYDREGGVQPSGAGIAQLITEGATFTSTPGVMANQPVAANHINYYLDTTWAKLTGGTPTQISDEINTAEWSLKGMKGSRWASDRSQASFKGHVDLKPKSEVKFTLHDSSVSRAIVQSLIQGNIYFLGIDAQGPLTDNLVTVTITGSPTGGTFTLTYKSQTTAGIAYNAAASAVQSALEALTSIGTGNVVVSGSVGGPYTVKFQGTLAQDTSALTASGAGLTPSGGVTVAPNPFYYRAVRYLAFRLSKLAAWKDSKGIYAHEVSGFVAEDSTSGHAIQCVSQTLEATL